MKCAVGWIISLVAFGLLAAPLAPGAQQGLTVARIGILCPAKCGGAALAALLQGLNELGHIEGKNLAIDYRAGEGKYEILPDLARELVRLGPDVIVAMNNPTGLALRDATRTIPIVMALGGNADQLGLITSLARPDGNITGLTILHSDLEPKRLEMLKESAPRVTRVAVLSNPGNPSHGPALRDIQAAARILKLRIQSLMAKDPQEIEDAFRAMGKARAGALLVQTDPMLDAHRERVAALALKNRLPTISMNRDFVEAGGMLAYGPDYPQMFRRAASFVDKILKGATPGDLPVEQPMRFELAVNLRRAKALGLTIPPTIMVRAERVIE